MNKDNPNEKKKRDFKEVKSKEKKLICKHCFHEHVSVSAQVIY